MIEARPSTRCWFPFRVTWSPDGNHLLYLAWGTDDTANGLGTTALIVVPVSSAEPPVMLVEGPGISVYEGAYGIASQVWAREPKR